MRTLTISIGTNKGGAPRIWIEGTHLERIGFAKGTRVETEWKEGAAIVRPCEAGAGDHNIGERRGSQILDLQGKAIGAAFVDVGMGLELDEGSLGGILRVTASTPEKRDHARQRISFVGGGAKDIYASNIQVADLNALNAVLAVVKWKKIRGFYRDLEREHHCTYTTDGNMLINGDLA